MRMYGISKFREKIRNHKIIIGAHVHLDSCFITELIGGAGFDFIWIDGEHSALDSLDIQYHVLACRAAGVASIVRVSGEKSYLCKHVIDMGADGIVFPMICTREAAQDAINNCFYPLKGTRGFGTRRACNYGWDNKNEYIREEDSMIFKILQIEHETAVKNLDEILEVEGIDSILIGANDLSTSMGYINRPYGQDETKDVFRFIIRKCRERGIPVGASIGYDKNAIRFWMENGIDWIGVGSDMDYLRIQAKNALEDSVAIAREAGLDWVPNL